MAIGSITIDISGQLTNAKEILDNLQKSVEKIDLSTSFGKQFKKMVDEATSLYNKSARNTQRKVSNEAGIEKVNAEMNSLFNFLDKTSLLLTNIKPLDLNIAVASAEVQELYEKLQNTQKELDELQSKNNFNNLIAQSKELQEAFQKIGLDASNMSKEQISRHLSDEYERITKTIQRAEAETQRYKKALEDARVISEDLNNKNNNLKNNTSYNSALEKIEQGRTQKLTGKEQVFNPDNFQTMIDNMRNMLQTMVPQLQKTKLDQVFNIDISSIKTLQDAQLALTQIRQNLSALSNVKVQNIYTKLTGNQIKNLESILGSGLHAGKDGKYTQEGAQKALANARNYLLTQGYDNKIINEIIPTTKSLKPFMGQLDSIKEKFGEIILVAKDFSKVTQQVTGTEKVLTEAQISNITTNVATNQKYKAQDFFDTDPRIQEQYTAFLQAAQEYKTSGLADATANNSFIAQLDNFIKNIQSRKIDIVAAQNELKAIIEKGEALITSATSSTQEAQTKFDQADAHAKQVAAQAEPIIKAKDQYNAFIKSLETRAEKAESDAKKYKDLLESLLKGSVGDLQGIGAEGSQKANAALEESLGLIDKYNDKLDQAKEKHQMLGKLEGVVQRWFSIYTVIRIVKKAIDDVKNTLTDLDKTITEIAIVTDMTQKDLWGQMSDYTAMARQYGASISGVYKVSQLYYQQG